MTGTLYLVATPIGNLEDLTYRARRILTEVERIACEDTRTSRVLLDRYDIRTPTTAYHKFNEKEKTPELIRDLLDGKDLALITDAGTPLISDPGSVLVEECVRSGITVTSIPGPSALTTALSLAGLPGGRFVFEGFLPASGSERKARISQLRNEVRTIVLYEAPHRLERTLKDLADAFGMRRIALCRELTKKYETICHTTLPEALEDLKTSPPRGEYVLVIEGASEEEVENERRRKWDGVSVEEHVRMYEEQGFDRKEAMKLAAKDRGLSRREIYQMLL